MPTVPDRLRPSLSRIAALLVGAVCAWATIRFKFDVPAELQSFATELLVAALVGGAGYLATHFGIAIKVNPDDAASPHAAAAGKAKQRARKRTRAIESRLEEHGLELRKEDAFTKTVRPEDLPSPPPFIRPPGD